MSIGLLLFNPRRFFQGRTARPAEQLAPSIFVATGYGLPAFAEGLAHRIANDAGSEVAYAIAAALFALAISPVLFVLGYWLPLRLVAGSPARPWESGGLSLAPASLGGVLMVLLAWAAPVGKHALGSANPIGLYTDVALWLTFLFGVWSLVILYQALLVRVDEERARFAIGACIAASIVLNGFFRAVA